MATLLSCPFIVSFSFKDTSSPEIYTLSLHDALPISASLPHHSMFCTCSRIFSSVALAAITVWEISRSDRKSTRLNSSHRCISYAVFCLKKKKITVRDIMIIKRLDVSVGARDDQRTV